MRIGVAFRDVIKHFPPARDHGLPLIRALLAGRKIDLARIGALHNNKDFTKAAFQEMLRARNKDCAQVFLDLAVISLIGTSSDPTTRHRNQQLATTANADGYSATDHRIAAGSRGHRA